MKHSNIDICATIHLEKFKFETIIEESYCKPYFDLLLLFPLKYKKLRKTFEENTLFPFCSLVLTASFLYGSGLSKMYKNGHMSDLYLYIDSHRAPVLEGLLPLLCWIYGEKNGYPDKENGLDNPQIWGGGNFFCMFIMNCTHQRLFWLVQFWFLWAGNDFCMCVCMYTLHQVSILKWIFTVTPFFPIPLQTSVCQVSRITNSVF